MLTYNEAIIIVIHKKELNLIIYGVLMLVKVDTISQGM